MRKGLTILLLVASSAFAQENHQPSWSISLNAFDMLLQSDPNLQSYWTPYFLNGFSINKRTKYFTAKFGANYTVLIIKTLDWNGSDQYTANGNIKEGRLNIGFEKDTAIFKVIRPHIGINLSLIKAFEDYIITGGIAGINEHRLIHKIGIGLYPNIGLELMIKPKVSISIDGEVIHSAYYLCWSKSKTYWKFGNFGHNIAGIKINAYF
jgi:hypothetical protein